MSHPTTTGLNNPVSLHTDTEKPVEHSGVPTGFQFKIRREKRGFPPDPSQPRWGS